MVTRGRVIMLIGVLFLALDFGGILQLATVGQVTCNVPTSVQKGASFSATGWILDTNFDPMPPGEASVSVQYRPTSGGNWNIFGTDSGSAFYTVTSSVPTAGIYDFRGLAGGIYSPTDTITIQDTPPPPGDPPVADANGPYSGVVGVPVQFDGSGSYDPDGDPITYEWSWGEGGGWFELDATPTHTYSSPGNYGISLRVDDGTSTDFDVTSCAIVAAPPANQDPVSVIDAPVTGEVGVAIQFNGDLSYDPDGSITAYLWNFGQGPTSTMMNPTHTYTSEGAFDVSLRVTDNDGGIDTSFQQINIAAGAVDPQGYFELNGETATPSSTHVFSSNVMVVDFVATAYMSDITGVRLEVYQGVNPVGTEDLVKQSALTWQGTYTFPSDGTYDVRGYIDWDSPTQSKRTMSITARAATSPLGDPIDVFIGSPLRIAAFGMVAIGLIDDYRRRKR